MLAIAAAVAIVPPVQADDLEPTGRWTANTRGQADTPPMGWNSWNAFDTAISEDKVIGTAEALVRTGLAKLGYRYVNIDDGWWHKRRQSDGKLQIRTDKFPSARISATETSFRPLVSRLHRMGLKAGIYTDIGHNSCSQSHSTLTEHLPQGTRAEREIGLAGNVEKDISLFFKDWQFDYIKVDACGIDEMSQQAWQRRGSDLHPHPTLIVRESVNRSNIPAVRASYQQVSDALERANPDGDYILSLCAWGAANVRAWGKDIGNLIRTSDDIRPTWSRMLHTFDSAANRPLYAQPGSWNDPDMLFVGHGDFDANHLREARSHFSIWAVINAPLLIGYDMRDAPQSLLDIWGNADLIRANQDPGGHQGVITYRSDDLEIISKTLTGTDKKVVAIFNRGVQPIDVVLLPKYMKFSDKAPVALRDLWSKEQLPAFTGELKLRVEPRETRVFEASGTRALPDGYFLSEIPGNVNVANDGVIRPQADPTIHRGIQPWIGTGSGGEPPVYAGYGGAAADEGPFGETIQLAGRKYDTGIGIHANSRLEVRNIAGGKTFSTLVGVDDNTPNTKAGVIFRVYGDGRLLAESPSLSFGAKPQQLTAKVDGVKIIELIAVQGRDANLPATTAWADAAILRR